MLSNSILLNFCRQGVRDSDPRMQALRKSLVQSMGRDNEDDLRRKMEELRRQDGATCEEKGKFFLKVVEIILRFSDMWWGGYSWGFFFKVLQCFSRVLRDS